MAALSNSMSSGGRKKIQRTKSVKFVKVHGGFSNAEKEIWNLSRIELWKKTSLARFICMTARTTAWGIDAGPVAAIRRAKRFSAGQPNRVYQRRDFDFQVDANHGGWNSDDIKNHNLGRFRLSVTRRQCCGGSHPANVREIFKCARSNALNANCDTVSYWQDDGH